MACAQTGSGKTAAFCLPVVSGLVEAAAGRGGRRDRGAFERRAHPRALILTPTRELAEQVYDEARKFSMQTGLRVAVAYGGASIYNQYDLEIGVDILIATPGCIVDMVERSNISLEAIKYLVMDEADRMLDMGFEPQIRKIVDKMVMPKSSLQTLLFSATFPPDLQRLASDFMSNYIFITVGRVGSSTDLTEQTIEFVNDGENKGFMLDPLQKQYVVIANSKESIAEDTMDQWTCLNFSQMRPEETQRFCMDLMHVCKATGMAVNTNPFLEIKSASPGTLEKALRDVLRRLKHMHEGQGIGNRLLLIVILPEVCAYYADIEKICEAEAGIVSHFCFPNMARKPSKQDLETIANKIYQKIRTGNVAAQKIGHPNEVNMNSCADIQGANGLTDYDVPWIENDLIDDGLDTPVFSKLCNIFSSGPCVGASKNSLPVGYPMEVVGNENPAERKSKKWFPDSGTDIDFLKGQNPDPYLRRTSEKPSARYTKYATQLKDAIPSHLASHVRLPSVEVRVGCDKIRVSMPLDLTVWELLQFALGQKNIKPKDMYFLLYGKHLDGKQLLNSVLLYHESIIHVIPRMRGGCPVDLLMQFEKLGDFLQQNSHRLPCHRVQIPHDYVQYDPNNPVTSTSILFLSAFSRYVIHQILVCVCRVGHQLEDVCWHGAFGIDDFLICNGQIIMNPNLPTYPFTPRGARADYDQLHNLISTHFHYDPNELPGLLSHLLKLLLSCGVRFMRDPDFVTFITNHPCLLSYADRGKLYDLVDLMIRKLDKTYMKKLMALFKNTGFSGWEAVVSSLPGFQRTYMYNAKPDPVTNVKTSLYAPRLDQCFHFGRNFLNHTRRWMTLEVGDAALTKLLEKLLPLVLMTIIQDFNGPADWNIANVICNSNGDQSTVL